ncbi:MAG: YdiU family protein [Magnetococcales bacterium]|nr:YdiU family protein [Magnetococcales bacterium]
MSNNGWQFDNSYTSLPEMMYVRLKPTKVSDPKMVLFNEPLALKMGLDFPLSGQNNAQLFAGNQIPHGAEPIAQAYAGHQFGHFTMLGDGRAIVLGEHITPDNRRIDIQFKGSGPTPFSRGGDGRAALGPMLREYIISEAMHGLGIPTTQSLAVVTTGENVYRENGPLPGAILTRVAASHIRVGTFEYLAMKGDFPTSKKLVDYALKRHYPQTDQDTLHALTLLKNVMEQQLNLIINWLRVGFIHGVMNTDNMTISGETIDYGPCAFMDIYNPETVFSSIDHGGRYAFGNQPSMAKWNLTRFAETLLPLIDSDSKTAVNIATEIIDSYDEQFETKWLAMMKNKLGLVGEEQGDKDLITQLLTLMEQNRADYTNTFFNLLKGETAQEMIFQKDAFKSWQQKWHDRRLLNSDSQEISQELMKKHNPVVIPRNHKVEEALDAACKNGDLTPFNNLLAAVKTPYTSQKDISPYQSYPTEGSEIYQTFCGT